MAFSPPRLVGSAASLAGRLAVWLVLLGSTASASLRLPSVLDPLTPATSSDQRAGAGVSEHTDWPGRGPSAPAAVVAHGDGASPDFALFPAEPPPRTPFSLPRVIADDRFTYTYDWEGRIVAVAPKTTAGQPAPERVEYTYDGLGRLLTRTHKGAIPAGGTDNDRPFIDGRTYTWEGASLAAEAGLNFAGQPTWRRQYLPGPSGLDDAPQVRVEAGLQSGSPTTTVFDIVRDEMGSVIAVAEDRSSSGQSPRLLARFHTSPYGGTHVELGPELLEIQFDATIDHVGSQHQRPDAEDQPNVAGSLVIRTTLPLDPASLVDGLLIEEKAGNESYCTSTRTDFTIGTNDDASVLLVMRTHGWVKGTSYRITLKPTITDGFGRMLRLPATDTSGVVVELPFGTDGSLTSDPKREFPLQPEEDAAANTLNGAFPGGINILHQGLWTDPVTGLGYARNRWLDSRNASWLTEDAAGPVDSPNLYAFVGWQPNMATDPMGLARPYSLPINPEAAQAVADTIGGAAEAAGAMVDAARGGSELGMYGQVIFQGIQLGLHTRERVTQARANGASDWQGVAVSVGDVSGFTPVVESLTGWEVYGGPLDSHEQNRRFGQGMFGLTMTAATVSGTVSAVRAGLFSSRIEPGGTGRLPSAKELHSRLPRSLNKKTVSTAHDTATLSGWSSKPEGFGAVSPEDVLSYSEEIGHPVRRAGAFDRGTPGKYFASHAERQAALAKPGVPVEVSSPMCADCIEWYRAHARFTGEIQIVTDPNVTRVFHPDGSVEVVK